MGAQPQKGQRMTYLDRMREQDAHTTGLGHGVALMKRNNRRVWLSKRRKVLGATDAVAVLGYSKFRTPVDVWGEKTGRWQPDDLAGKYVVERGNLLESLILAEWAKRNDATPLDFPPLIGHPTYPMLAASLDGIGLVDGEPVICEAKAVTWRTKGDWWNDAMLVPDQYAVQVLIQLAVTGLETAHICADVAGEFTQVEIRRDRDFEAWALPALGDWWKRHVDGDETPDPDPVRDYPHLNRIWVPDPGVTIDATPELLRDVMAYQAAAAKAKEHKARADELRGHIRIAMRDATTVVDPWTGDRLAGITKSGALSVAKQQAVTE